MGAGVTTVSPPADVSAVCPPDEPQQASCAPTACGCTSRPTPCSVCLALEASPPPATLDPAQASPLTALFTREAADPARRSVWRNLPGRGRGGARQREQA